MLIQSKWNRVVTICVALALLSGLLLGFSLSVQSASDAPVIQHASIQPTKVHPGDTMTVIAEVSGSSEIESVTADMGGIEVVSLSLTEGSIYHGTWQGQWLVRDTTARDYVTTIVATNSLGKSSSRDIIWSDPQTYERYHSESAGQQTTTQTTLQTALTLTFTPNVTGDFLILAYAILGQSNISYATEWQVDYGAGPTVIDVGALAPVNAAERATAGTHDVVNLSGGTSYSFRIKYRTTNASGTASIEKLSLAAIAVSAGPDDSTKHAETTAASTASATYVDNTTLTFTPSTQGDYLVLASMGIASSVTSASVYSQLTLDTVSQGEVVRTMPVTDQYEIYAISRKVNLTAAEHTLSLQYKTDGGTVYIRNARITAVRLSDLGDAAYVESEGVDSTTGSGYVIKPGATLTFDHLTYENNLELFFALLNGSTTNKDFYGAGFSDGVLQHERIMRPVATTDYLAVYAFGYKYATSASHTDDIRFGGSPGATASMKNARVLVIRLDTLNPFSDSGHTTYQNNFNSLALSTAYTQGTYQQVSHNFTVAYYDNDGNKVLSDGVLSDANGVVNSQILFTNYPASAPGTWHAVLYDDSVASPPATYTANDSNSIREYTFTVTAEAIPEFPTVMAGIGVVGLCFGIYYWMKRRLARVKA